MKTVRLIGWKPGLKKISLVDLLKHYAGHNLGTAHQAMVRLMEGGVVEVQVDDRVVKEFVAAAEQIGAVCECQNSEPREANPEDTL
jgi:hypothetical protein